MIKKIIYPVLGLGMLLASGCGDDLAEKNIDPNNPVSVPAEFLLTQAQHGLVENYWGRTLNFGFSMLMVQHLAETEYTDASRYNFTPPDFDGAFTSFYTGDFQGGNAYHGALAELLDARRLVEESTALTDAEKANQLAIIDIIKVWTYQGAVDLWGNIPYSQALNPSEFVKPTYDDAEVIYRDLLSTLTQSVAAINESATGFTTGDAIYNGNMTQWKKFANALKVRVAMRMADVDAAAAGTAINEAMTSGVFQSNSDGAIFGFSSETSLANPFWIDNSPNNRDDFAVSGVLVDHMKSTSDPRLSHYADANAAGEVVGLTYGLIDNDATIAQVGKSRPSSTIRSATTPATLMSYSELKLLHAEAIARGFVSGDVASVFEEAIRASMEQWGVTDQAAIDAYVAANGFSTYAGGYKEAIGTEKWVSLYTNGLESWAEWRRLDFPVLSLPNVASSQLFNSVIPVRGLYPQSEFTRNEENVTAAGDNTLSRKIFWDVN